MIEQVTRYKTSDGTLWDSKEDAKSHEVQQDTLAKLTTLLQASVRTGRVEAVLKEILFSSQEVSALLGKYRLQLPREKKEKPQSTPKLAA